MRSGEVSSIGAARREFLRKESPWALGVGIFVLVALRALVGELTWRDAVAVAAMLAIYPFGEWAIHVYLLHAKPMRIRGREIETVAARAHRAHHGEPNDLDMVLLYWWQAAFLMLVAVPLTIGIGVGDRHRWSRGRCRSAALISAAIAGYCMVFVYEWTHFLIHTAYGPRSRGIQDDLAQPPPPPLQERALLARDHEQPQRPRPRHQPRPARRSEVRHRAHPGSRPRFAA